MRLINGSKVNADGKTVDAALASAEVGDAPEAIEAFAIEHSNALMAVKGAVVDDEHACVLANTVRLPAASRPRD